MTAAVENAEPRSGEAGHEMQWPWISGPTGRLLKTLPQGIWISEDTVKLYKEVVSIGARTGADLVLIGDHERQL